MDKLQWLKERQKGIGGSDVGAIMGLNKWKTAFQVYLEKTEPITEENQQSEAAYWGTQLEDMVAKEFTIRSGKKVRRDTRHFVHKDYPFMVANIDRRVVGENAVLECKTVNQFGSKEWSGEEIPDSYLLQVQHYLAVTGAEIGYIACLIGGQHFIWKQVERDEELINLIIKAEKEFWSMVVNKTPPALDGSSAAEKWLNEKYKNSEEGLEINLDTSYSDKLKKYNELKDKEQDVKEQLKEIENQIKNEMGKAEIAYIPNFQVTWKQVFSNRTDTNKLKSEYKDVYESCLKKTTSRRFTVKEVIA